MADDFMAGLLDWLRQRCQLAVRIAEDGDAILPRRVLFAPEGAHLVVQPEGRVHLSDAEPVNGHRPSVDVTFTSLAKVYGARAAGVLLTGMGSDGAAGLLAIREAGGVTMVQDEESCAVFGMPRAAIELGAAQQVLSPAGLVRSLNALHVERVRSLLDDVHPCGLPIGAASTDALPLEQFIRFRDLIEDRCGLHFDESQRASLSASLRARMQQLELIRIEDYDERLRGRSAGDEFRKLINLVTITETCFFRDAAQFRLLRRHILPTMLAERSPGPSRTLRIWSAGCSSGEEAYSIALTLREMGVARAYPDWTFEIVGTDLNTEVLEAARRGVYSARALRNVEGDCLRHHFDADGPRFRLHDDIRQGVRFERGNLSQAPMTWPSGERQDIVFCKNVAIYFRPEVTRRVVRGLTRRSPTEAICCSDIPNRSGRWPTGSR